MLQICVICLVFVNYDTKNVMNMSYMFNKCNSLTNLNLSNFNTRNVTDMSYMFSGCESLDKKNLMTKDNRVLNQIYQKYYLNK